MEVFYKIAFGIAFTLALCLLIIKFIFPSLSLWVVFSPLIVLGGIVIFIWISGAFFELFKIILKWVLLFLILYLFYWVFFK